MAKQSKTVRDSEFVFSFDGHRTRTGVIHRNGSYWEIVDSDQIRRRLTNHEAVLLFLSTVTMFGLGQTGFETWQTDPEQFSRMVGGFLACA